MRALVLCVVFTIVGRITGIVYSYLYSHMTVEAAKSMSGVMIGLSAAKHILIDLSFTVTAVVTVLFLNEKKSVKIPVFTYLAVLVADSAVSIVYDCFIGQINYLSELILGIGRKFIILLFSMLLLFVGCKIAMALLKRERSMKLSAICAAALPAAIDFVSVAWTSVASLIAVEFLPFDDDLYAMILDVGTVLASGAVTVVAVILMLRAAEKAKNEPCDEIDS